MVLLKTGFSTDSNGILHSADETIRHSKLNVDRVNEINRGTPMLCDERCLDGANVTNLTALRQYLESKDLLTNNLNGTPFHGVTIVARCSVLYDICALRRPNLYDQKKVWREGKVIYIQEPEWIGPSTHGSLLDEETSIGCAAERKLTSESDTFPNVLHCESFTYRVIVKSITPDCRLIVSKEIDFIHDKSVGELKCRSSRAMDRDILNITLQKQFFMCALSEVKQTIMAVRMNEETKEKVVNKVLYWEDVGRLDTNGFIPRCISIIHTLCSRLATFPFFLEFDKKTGALSHNNSRIYMPVGLLLKKPGCNNVCNAPFYNIHEKEDIITIVYDKRRIIPHNLSVHNAHIISVDTFRKHIFHETNGPRIEFPLNKVIFIVNSVLFSSILQSVPENSSRIWRRFDQSVDIFLPQEFTQGKRVPASS